MIPHNTSEQEHLRLENMSRKYLTLV